MRYLSSCAPTRGVPGVWLQTPGELRFKVGSITKLIPSPVKGAGAQVRHMLGPF